MAVSIRVTDEAIPVKARGAFALVEVRVVSVLADSVETAVVDDVATDRSGFALGDTVSNKV